MNLKDCVRSVVKTTPSDAARARQFGYDYAYAGICRTVPDRCWLVKYARDFLAGWDEGRKRYIVGLPS